MRKIKYRVNLTESERGWGQKYDSVLFDTYDEAATYRDSVNAQNVETTVPDWYVIADQKIDVVET